MHWNGLSFWWTCGRNISKKRHIYCFLQSFRLLVKKKMSAGVFASSHRKIHLIKVCFQPSWPQRWWSSLSWQLWCHNSLNLTLSELFVWLNSVCQTLPKPWHKLPAATEVMKDSVSPCGFWSLSLTAAGQAWTQQAGWAGLSIILHSASAVIHQQ